MGLDFDVFAVNTAAIPNIAPMQALFRGADKIPGPAHIVCEQTRGERLQAELFFQALKRTLSLAPAAPDRPMPEAYQGISWPR